MNERIKECWQKAVNNDDTWDGQVRFLEKFAELIVRECANYVFSDDQDHKAMLKHFGVEE